VVTDGRHHSEFVTTGVVGNTVLLKLKGAASYVLSHQELSIQQRQPSVVLLRTSTVSTSERMLYSDSLVVPSKHIRVLSGKQTRDTLIYTIPDSQDRRHVPESRDVDI
jgi:hypothetical protein